MVSVEERFNGALLWMHNFQQSFNIKRHHSIPWRELSRNGGASYSPASHNLIVTTRSVSSRTEPYAIQLTSIIYVWSTDMTSRKGACIAYRRHNLQNVHQKRSCSQISSLKRRPSEHRVTMKYLISEIFNSIDARDSWT